MPIRTHVRYRGHVQGVCFRATAQEFARGLAVTGYVRNLADGSVELEAQGEPDQVDSLLDSISRHYVGNIRDISKQACSLRENDAGFRITH